VEERNVMPEALIIEPDAAFLMRITKAGGGDLKKCYQCGTCSVVCTLSPAGALFPRRQIIQAQWGLKGRLMADPAIWLCHNCGDCTANCPRGAKPGEVFGALRNEAIQHFSFPGFLGPLLSRPVGLFALLMMGALVFGLLVLMGPMGAPRDALIEHQFKFTNLYPLWLIETFFFSLSGLILIAFLGGMVRFIRTLRASGADKPILAGLVPAAVDIMTHARFAKCGQNRGRYIGHLATFWGFLGLAGVSAVVGFATMFGMIETPLPQTNVLKILGNLSGLVAIVGVVLLLGDRLRDPVKRAASTYFDWFFIWTLTGVIATGTLIQLLRLVQSAPWMYLGYFVHLVLIFVLFMSAPYTKFAHVAYRTVAMAMTGRK
jgi:quinone-modifying oxidoreductase subunit QmoC